MPLKSYTLLLIIPCLAFSLLRNNSTIVDLFLETQTGIFLDSNENEVLLISQGEKPLFFKSYIFTPVCKTGECFPVFVNINWDLRGKFKSLEIPEGKFLTKLNHVPFSPEDYQLLDKILRGEDPRYDDISKHDVSEGSGKEDRSSPSVSLDNRAFKTKYEMVDGITGSTLPEQKDKFVPGALYTSYTLWDLANSHESTLRAYTKDSLLDQHTEYLLIQEQLNCQDFVLDELASRSSEDNSRINLMMGMLDSTEGKINLIILDRTYYYHLEIDTVYNSLSKKFFSSGSTLDPDNQVKKRILNLWSYGKVKDETLFQLSELISNSGSLFENILEIFRNHPIWPERMIYSLLYQIDLIKDADQQLQLFNVIYENKDNISSNDWVYVKKTKKKYKF